MYLQQKYSKKNTQKVLTNHRGGGRGLGLKIKYWIDHVVTVITLYNISYTTLLIQNTICFLASIITYVLLTELRIYTIYRSYLSVSKLIRER